ncbi:MAG: alpha-L-fucosidase [Clostridia bacterium]|nr:alpha-L-fucosidase [Clostridia bacterium]
MMRTDWFSEAGFGLFVHWTTHSLPECGEKKSYQDAVRDFQLDKFVEQVVNSGAKFLFFTTSWAKMMLPFPLDELDEIVPDHTCERDLIGELSDALDKHGIKLLIYFNGDGSQDPLWQEATGFKEDPKKHAEYCYKITEAISKKYGKRLSGWWIDCCYEPGICNGTGVRYDYERYAKALRSGNEDSIVAFNFRGTCPWGSVWGKDIADYQAGEENDISFLPTSRFSGEGDTQWFALCWMDEFWVHEKEGEPTPQHSNQNVLDYVNAIKEKGGVFAYNCAVYQEGLIADKTYDQLKWLNKNGISK